MLSQIELTISLNRSSNPTVFNNLDHSLFACMCAYGQATMDKCTKNEKRENENCLIYLNNPCEYPENDIELFSPTNFPHWRLNVHEIRTINNVQSELIRIIVSVIHPPW